MPPTPASHSNQFKQGKLSLLSVLFVFWLVFIVVRTVPSYCVFFRFYPCRCLPHPGFGANLFLLFWKGGGDPVLLSLLRLSCFSHTNQPPDFFFFFLLPAPPSRLSLTTRFSGAGITRGTRASSKTNSRRATAVPATSSSLKSPTTTATSRCWISSAAPRRLCC